MVVAPPAPPLVPPWVLAYPMLQASVMEARLTIAARLTTSSDVGVGAAEANAAKRPAEMTENFILNELVKVGWFSGKESKVNGRVKNVEVDD